MAAQPLVGHWKTGEISFERVKLDVFGSNPFDVIFRLESDATYTAEVAGHAIPVGMVVQRVRQARITNLELDKGDEVRVTAEAADDDTIETTLFKPMPFIPSTATGLSALRSARGSCARRVGSAANSARSAAGTAETELRPSRRVSATEVVGRADFDGDGRADVLLSVSCSGGTIAECCAGRSSHALYAYSVTAGPDGQPKMIGDVIRAGASKPGDQYGPAQRNIKSIAVDERGRVTTTEYIYYPEQYTPDQVGGVDPTADIMVVHAMRNGAWAGPVTRRSEPPTCRA